MNRFWLFGFLALFFAALGQDSIAGTEVKTLEFMVDQANGADALGGGAGGGFWNTRTIRLKLPESSISVQSAWIEVEIYTNNTTDYNLLIIQFPRDTNVLVYPEIAYVWDNSGEQGIIAAKVDVTSFFSGKTFPLDVNGAVSILGNSVRNNKMKLFITYTYDDTSTVEMRTIKYPLDTNVTLVTAIIQRTYYFDYNAKIADHIGTVQAFVQIYGNQGPNAAVTDGNMVPRIGTGAFSTSQFYIRTAGATDYDMDYLFDINDTFLPNTQQAIDVNIENSASTTQDIHSVGGEVVIDYNADATAAVQTKTVSYFLGQDVNKDRANTKVNFSKIVNLPETGVTVRALYAKIYHGWNTGSAADLTVDVNVGSTAATKKTYREDSDDQWAGETIIINDLNEAMGGLVGQTDTNISIDFQFSSEAGATAVGVELYITYDYDSNSTTQQKTTAFFAGMNPTSKSTDYNATASVYVKESGASKKSAWLLVDHYTTTSNTTVGDYNITTDINASSPLKVSQEADGENRTGHSLNGDADNFVTAADANYTITYQYVSSSSDDNAVMSGKLFLTYNFTPSVAANYSFALNLPSSGCTQNKGSYGISGSCDRAYFETTDTTGNSDQDKVDAEGQTSTIPFFVYDNQSTTSNDLNILVDLNATLPTTLRLKMSKIYGGWAASCTGNTDTNCVQVDINSSYSLSMPALEDVFIRCIDACFADDARTFMKFDIRPFPRQYTSLIANLTLNVLQDNDDDDCAFYHLDQNQGWTESDSAANIYAMRTGTFLSSGASLCFAGTGNQSFVITSLVTAALAQGDTNFSLRFEDPDNNTSTPGDLNNSDQLKIGGSAFGVQKIFKSSEASADTPTLDITILTGSQNLGKATYSAGTQDLNIFVWGDFVSASQGSVDRNTNSRSVAP